MCSLVLGKVLGTFCTRQRSFQFVITSVLFMQLAYSQAWPDCSRSQNSQGH